MDGLDVVRRVRAQAPCLPAYIIVLTTKGDKSDIVAALDAGADDYLTKPFDSQELRARIDVGRRMTETQARLAQQVRELREAMEHIKTLQGILPICSFCKKVRNDSGYWKQVDTYISEHTEVQFSHGICPECWEQHYAAECKEDVGMSERE